MSFHWHNGNPNLDYFVYCASAPLSSSSNVDAAFFWLAWNRFEQRIPNPTWQLKGEAMSFGRNLPARWSPRSLGIPDSKSFYSMDSK